MAEVFAQKPLGTIATFYSWKGGVGRTMALANIAVQLARMGTNVLMVDWDLESPGLDRYFLNPDARKSSKIGIGAALDRTGLMGLLQDACRHGDAGLKQEDWKNRLVKIDVPRADLASAKSSATPIPTQLHLLPSGHGTDDYPEKVATFSWPDFFAQARGGEWLEALRDQWSAEYDFVFIDSRTGLTDSGGVCTIQMPHILVLVFTANDQSLDGGLRVVAAAQKERSVFGYDRAPLAVIPILSRWEGENEVDIGDRWMRRFDAVLAPLTGSWLPNKFTSRQFLEKTRIPHVARFSFGEPLPVLTHSLSDPGLPGLYFDALARLIQSHLSGAGNIIDPTYNDDVLPNKDGAKIIILPFASLGSLFKGRSDAMYRLRKRFTDGGSSQASVVSVGLHGLGGIGKTRMAVEYAWQHRNDYSALLFALAESPEALRRNLAKFASPLLPGLDTIDDEARLQSVLDWLNANPGWLLILDNVSSSSAMEEAERLMGGLTGGHVIVTSRLSNFSAHTEPVEIYVLTLDAAAAFLLERTEGRRRAADNDELKAREMAEELGQLALALEQAGAYISKNRLRFDDYLEQWRSNRDKVLAWSDATLMTYPSAVAVTWQTSVAQLNESGRCLLERLAWLAPERVPESLLDIPIPGKEDDDLLEAFADLSAYSLVLRGTDELFFHVHRLVQDVTRHSLSNDDRRHRLVEALGWIDAAFSGDPVDSRNWHRLDPIVPHARAVATYADDAGIPEPTSRLMSQLGLLLDAKALHADAEPLLRRAFAIDEKKYGPDHPKIATHLTNLSSLLRATNRLSEAEPLARRALAIDEKSFGQDHPNVARSLNSLALLLQETNRLDQAEPLVRRALAIFERSSGGDNPEVARSLNNLAILLRATNRMSEAEPLVRRALEIDEKYFGSAHPNVARSLNNLAILLQTTNRLDEAEPLVRRALAIDEISVGPDHPKVAIRLNNLASLLQATGRIGEAESLVRRSLKILARFAKATGHNHPYFEPVRTNYTYILQSQGRSEASIADAIEEAVDGSLKTPT